MEVNNPNECLPGLFNEESDDVDILEGAEEVDGVNSTASGLLSLTGKAEELLLSLVAKGKGGVQRLLNLRLVCRHTKGWVDDLPLLHGQRLFANCQATVDLSERGNLDKFLENPPPPHVTSLRLSRSLVYFVEEDTWNRFVEFWSPRLKSLELGECLPLNAWLTELVSSSSIRNLRCEGIKYGHLADVPDFLLQLEELRVEEVFGFALHALPDPQRKAALQILESPGRLVIPDWKIRGDWALNFAADLLRVRKKDAKSQLTFKFGYHSNEMIAEPLQDFVAALAASPLSSSIRIDAVTEEFLREAVGSFGEEAALKCFRCVKSIWTFLGDFDEIYKLANFPNLREIECDTENLVQFPVQNGFLPRLLTSLDLSRLFCSAGDLVRSLNFVKVSCPFLETLKLFWKFWSDPNEEEEEEEQFGAPQEDGAFFPNLRSLTFHIDEPAEKKFGEIARLVLSEGLGLPQLSLISLVVKFEGWKGAPPPAPLFDAELLRSLLEGPMGKTLCHVNIDEYLVAEGARELLETLEEKAKENEAKK